MTIEVKITHNHPDYDKCITVEEQGVDINGLPYSRNFPGYKHIVQPGQSIRKYVYGGNVLVITEGPNVSDLPASGAAPASA